MPPAAADDIGVVLGLAAGDSQRLLGIAHEAGTSLDEDEPFRLKIVGVPDPSSAYTSLFHNLQGGPVLSAVAQRG